MVLYDSICAGFNIINGIVSRWNPVDADNGEKKKARHIRRCDLCRAEGKEKPYKKEVSSSMRGEYIEWHIDGVW